MQYHLCFDYDIKSQTIKAFEKIKELVRTTGQTNVAIYVSQEKTFCPENFEEKDKEWMDKLKKEFHLKFSNLELFLITETRLRMMNNSGFPGGIALFFNKPDFVASEIAKGKISDSVYVPCYMNEEKEYLKIFSSSVKI